MEQQRDDLLRLLLLHPVPGAVDELAPNHARTGLLLHAFERAWCLIDTSVALAGDEARGHVDGAAGEHLLLDLEAAGCPHAIPVQATLEARPGVLCGVGSPGAFSRR